MTTKQKSEIELLNEMNEKLNMLVALNAVQGKDRDDKISTMVGLGFTNADIGKLLGIPKGTVDGIRAGKKGAAK